ncbi:MIP18 family protein F45G2.10-like [Triticum aestivum]|uniref:MIP18 family protein F45G2.10-like n=1 Tax=Triticum aestivum TaxID=4565 RepID=UPI00098AB82E|nr:MIP18 family protein F45G2.10-like [Triticum aestivum]
MHERPEHIVHPAHAALDALDVFDTVQDIKDPEHPYSLEQIRCVLSQESASVSQITFTPTVQHCSMATVIGLCLRLKLMQNPLDTGMWTQPRPQLYGNQDGDSVDGILRRPASFPDHAHDLHPAAPAPALLNFAPVELL